KAVDKMGLKGKVFFATFDLSPEISAGIKDGTIAFAIDQQPYLQGYIPVAVLALMKEKKSKDLPTVMAALKDNPKAKKRFDECACTLPTLRRVMGRSESGSVAGAVLVFVVFALTASDSGMFALDGVINWATVSAYLGIVATGACLLMIAGEFDRSLGSMIGFTGMMAAIPPLFYGVPVWIAMLAALACAL